MNIYYLAVPVGEGFPEHSGRYKCIDKDGEAHTMNFNRGNNFFHWPVSGSKTGKYFITHWLEPREGVLLQREELEGYKNKMECLLGYLEAWLINKPLPHELELVVKEADEFISSLTSKIEVK